MTFYFVRHGESEANRLHEISNRGLKHGLTEHGRAQARALADSLRERDIRYVYASPLLRAQQTADILAHELGAAVQTTDALREFDCGVAEGRSDADAWALYASAEAEWRRERWASRIDGGESVIDMAARFEPFVEGLFVQSRASAGGVVLVGHGGLYRWMLPRVLANVDLAYAWAHSITYTGAIVAAISAGALVCTAWCQHELPPPGREAPG
jgi:broad specificity phosphatase PhoE